MYKKETFFGTNTEDLISFLNEYKISKENIISIVPIQTALAGQIRAYQLTYQLIYWEEAR